MSFAYPRHLLNDEQKDTIYNLLNFKPLKPFLQRGNKKFFAPLEDEEEYGSSDIIQFYNNKKIDDVVHIILPYFFSAALFGIIPNDNIDYPTCTVNFTGKLRDYQIVVFEEALEQIKAYGTTTLGLYPGFGKTIEGARLTCELGLLTLIYCHRETLALQWLKTYQDFTDAEVWVVGQKAPKTCNVIVCMDTRYHIIPPEMIKQIGFLIVDEAHTFCTSSRVPCLLAVQPKYIVIETATLERDDDMHQMMYAMVGEHGIYRTDNKPFKVFKIETGITPERKNNSIGMLDWSHLQKTTLLIPERVKMIVNIVKENIEEKTLILTAVVEHAKLIEEELSKEEISFDVLYRNKKNYIDRKVLIGTISKIGTGFDQATFCEGYDGIRFKNLILTSSIKKVSLLEQSVGRVFRAESPVVYHFVDNDDIYRNHWRVARKWYNIRGGEVIEPAKKKREKKEVNNNSQAEKISLSEAQNIVKKSGALYKSEMMKTRKLKQNIEKDNPSNSKETKESLESKIVGKSVLPSSSKNSKSFKNSDSKTFARMMFRTKK